MLRSSKDSIKTTSEGMVESLVRQMLISLKQKYHTWHEQNLLSIVRVLVVGIFVGCSSGIAQTAETVGLEPAKSNEWSKNMEQPLFFLDIESEACLFTLSCNGVFVYDNKDGTPDRVTIPVSWSMIKGLNEITLECAPSENATGEDTNFCTVSLLMRSAEASSEANRSVMTICYKHHEDKSRLYLESSVPGKFNHSSLLPDDEGQILVGPVTPRLDTQTAGVKCSRNITLPYKIPTWKWQKSDIIENDENLLPDLNKEIERIWNMHKARDVDGLLSLIEERMVEMAAALHKDLDQVRTENRESILETLKDDDVKPFPLYPDHNLLFVHENKKLVEVRDWQNKDVIAVPFSSGGCVRMSYIFRKEKGKWIVCR